ncbi:sulfite exporter TauE/SafE family protein [Chloroflexota bacterium]
MSYSWQYILILLAAGLGGGFAQGMLGVGGCFIMVPVTTIVFQDMGVPLDTAVKLAFGTNLLVLIPGAISSSLGHHRKRAVWWKAGITMGVFVAMGALLGSTITSQFISGRIIKIAFGAVVLAAAVRMLTARPPQVEEEPRDDWRLWGMWGFPVGLVSGLIAIGGGSFMVPILTTVLKFKMHLAVGTSAAAMIFTGTGGALGYIINGLSVPSSALPPASFSYINFIAWGCLTTTSVTMAQVGARTAHLLHAKYLRWLFVIAMVYVGLRMIGIV